MKLSQFDDGTSNTLLLGECMGGTRELRDTDPDAMAPTLGRWLDYSNSWMGVGSAITYFDNLTDGKFEFSWGDFSGPHPGMVNFAFGDGSVRGVARRIPKDPRDPDVFIEDMEKGPWWALSGYADSSTIGFQDYLY